jgi:hypothetical protein
MKVVLEVLCTNEIGTCLQFSGTYFSKFLGSYEASAQFFKLTFLEQYKFIHAAICYIRQRTQQS